jgi:hypothetical protein
MHYKTLDHYHNAFSHLQCVRTTDQHAMLYCSSRAHHHSFSSILGYISAIAMLVNAVFNFYVIFKYPEIEEQQHRKVTQCCYRACTYSYASCTYSGRIWPEQLA